MKILRVTLDIPVLPLPGDEQAEAREQFAPGGTEEVGEDGPEDDGELFDPDSYEPSELADVLANSFHDEMIREMFAGSGMYVRFDDAITVVSAEWAPTA